MEDGNSELLGRFLAADSWDEAREILEAHPEMLGDEVLSLLTAEIERHGDDPDLAAHLTEEKRFLLALAAPDRSGGHLAGTARFQLKVAASERCAIVLSPHPR